MLLYHFTQAEYALDNVEKKRIKIAQLHKLNDPYELSAVCAEPPYGVKNRDALVNMFKENIGIICFSEKYNCPIMWGHYADSHTGICLVFEVSGEFKNSSLLKVKYCKNLLKVCIDQEGRLVEAEKLAKKIVSHKYKGWEYEKEYRVFVPLEGKVPENGNYFYDFTDEFRLKGIILGCKCQYEVGDDKFKAITENYHDAIAVTKARLSDTQFSVEKE